MKTMAALTARMRPRSACIWRGFASLVDRDPALPGAGGRGKVVTRDAAVAARGAVGAGKAGQWTVEDATTFSKKCDPYEQGGKPLAAAHALALMDTLDGAWTLSPDSLVLSRQWQTLDLMAAADFVQKVAVVAQNEGQAPWRTLVENTQASARAWSCC